MLQKLGSNSFLRSVSVLAGGTLLAQIITLAVLPILTRIYTPDDFSVLASYVAFISVVSVIACMRLEIAIPLPEDDRVAINLLGLSLFFSFFISLLIACVIFFTPQHILIRIGLELLFPYLWMLPVGVFFIGTSSALQYWAARKKEFYLISKTKVRQSIISSMVQVGGGYFYGSVVGLLFGFLMVSASGFFVLTKFIIGNSRELISKVSASAMLNALSEYRRFPKYSTLEALTNSAAIQVPIIIISTALVGPEAGCLFLAMRVMQMPMSLLGSAVSQVFLAHAAEEHRNNTLNKFFNKTILDLVKVGLGPIFFIGIVAPKLFIVVFGPEWGRAGEVVVWMIPWVSLQFITSPVSMVLHVTNNQKVAFFLQVFGFLLRICIVLAALNYDQTNVVEYYCLSGAIFYSIYFCVVVGAAGSRVGVILRAMAGAFPYVLIWGLMGVIAYYLTGLLRV